MNIMNIMNVNSTMFGAAKLRVNWAKNVNNKEYPVSKELKDRVNSLIPRLEAEAEAQRAVNLTLAQKNDSLLINAGPLTTQVKDVSKISDELLWFNISDNIDMNHLVKKGMSLDRFLKK